MLHGRETRVETVVLQILGQDPDSLGTLERKRVSRFVKQSFAREGWSPDSTHTWIYNTTLRCVRESKCTIKTGVKFSKTGAK